MSWEAGGRCNRSGRVRSSASTADLYGAAAGAFAVTCDPCGSKGTAGVARMQAVSEGGASRVAVQLVGGAGAGDRQRDAAGARDEPCGEAR